MRRFGILALTFLALASCAPEKSAHPGQILESFRGDTIIFRSNVYSSVVALYLDDGAYRNYADVSEVGGPSDIGGALAPCGEGVSKCVEVAGLYILVPPPGKARWNFAGYDFHTIADPLDREGRVVVVSRNGDESYSYGFSPGCGVRWLNASVGRKGGEEVFYPVGRSLFSDIICEPSRISE